MESEMSHVTTENSLEILSLRYGRSLLPLSMAAREIGINLRTAHNQISKGIFPVPTILQARRRYVHVEDLAGYIDRLRRTGGTESHLPTEGDPDEWTHGKAGNSNQPCLTVRPRAVQSTCGHWTSATFHYTYDKQQEEPWSFSNRAHFAEVSMWNPAK
jgi:hypothetical protein